MSTTTETVTLTAEDIKALRSADNVVFRHYKGVATMEAGLDSGWGDEPRIFTATQQRLFPETERTGSSARLRSITVRGGITWYEGDSRRSGGPESTGFEMVHSAKHDEVWKTIASLLKTGDEVYLGFVGDRYSNGYSRAAGLHVDGLKMVVRRPGRVLTFNVDTSVCAANTARMVKPHGG